MKCSVPGRQCIHFGSALKNFNSLKNNSTVGWKIVKVPLSALLYRRDPIGLYPSRKDPITINLW